MQLQWLPPALTQLREIERYYRGHGGTKAVKTQLSPIMESVNLLPAHPYLGKEDPMFKEIKPYRYLVCGDYRVYYYLELNVIYIAALWDMRRNPSGLTEVL